MGAAAVEMRARQIPLMQSGVGGLIVLNLIISFSIPGISYGGHIGGLIGGALAGLLLRAGDLRKVPPALAAAACVVLAAAAFAGSVASAHSSEVESTGAAPAALSGVEP